MEYLDEVNLYVLNNLRVQGDSAIKYHLAQYSSEIITNSLIRAIRINDSLSLNDYKNLLLADSLEINKTGLGGDTPIYAATLANNLWIVQDLIAKNADVNALCVNGTYPVLAACTSSEKLELLNFLLASGGNPNLVTDSGDTSFIYCAKGNSPQSITKIIEAGADMNFRDNNNCTPLHGVLFADKTDNMIALCHGAKDKKQLEAFREQVEEKPDYKLCELAHSILNSIETRMNLSANLHIKIKKQQLKPKI